MNTKHFLVALSLCLGAPAVADDDQRAGNEPTPTTKQSRPSTTQDSEPRLETTDVMKITQSALTHVAAAERALARGDKAAARSALAKSEKELSRIYETSPMTAALNEIDEAIRTVKSGQQDLQALDLAPITASIRMYESYMDPDVRAGIDEARQRAKQNDAQGTEDALRMVRDRVALDVAFLPVEEAYMRVLAAQQALQSGDTKLARQMIQHVPVVVSQVQVSRPLVPIRFKLHAAAEAAEAGNWQRSQKLLREVNRDITRLEDTATDPQLRKDITALGNDLEKLGRGPRPQPRQIRELALRTRDIGETPSDRGSDRG